MHLFLQSQDINEASFAWIGEKGELLKRQDFQTRPEELLKHLVAFLQANDIFWEDVKGVIVVCGPGSFTSTRCIVAIANTIVFAQHASLWAIENAARDPLETVLEKIFPLQSKGIIPPFTIPVYDREPHITTPSPHVR